MYNTKKIRLTCNWTSIPTDEILVKRFNSCFITKNNFNPKYVFTHENNFDYLVILNTPRDNSLNKLINPSKTIINYLEPSWHPYVYQNHDLNLLRSDWIVFHNIKLLNNKNKKSIEIPGLLPHQLFQNDCQFNLDYFLNKTFNKSKKCSFIISNKMPLLIKNIMDDTIYAGRLRILKQILKDDLDIDIYGRGLDVLKNKFPQIKGEIEYKFNALKDYQFSICTENSIETGYFSEKLFDCILTDTTPIYIGCPNIKDYFNNIHTIHLQPKGAIKQIQNILDKNLILDQSDNKKLLEYKYNFYVQIVNLIQKYIEI
jgi:hypothetical protein